MENKYIDYFKLKKHLNISQKELVQIQYKKLKYIIKYAYENIPFYHRKYDNSGIKPSDIDKISDINKLPYVTKPEIQSNYKTLINSTIDLSKTRKNTTSGSTGTPLSIYSDKHIASLSDASWIRAYLENGMKINDKMAVIRTPSNFPKKKRLLETLGILKRKYISVEQSPMRQRNLLEDFKPGIIRSYPSTLISLADAFNEDPLSISPKKLFTSAELVDGITRGNLESFFKSELFDHYSCNEVGLIAWECNEHYGYHMNSDNLVLEIIVDEENAQRGEIGEIILTDLNNVVMPLIRYKIGDLGIKAEDPCSCGINMPLLRVLEGRSDDMLYTTSGVPVSPHMIKYFLKRIFGDLADIQAFRVVQERLDLVLIYLVLTDGVRITDSVYSRANDVISEVFGYDMKYKFIEVDYLVKHPSGKLRMSESKLNMHTPKIQ